MTSKMTSVFTGNRFWPRIAIRTSGAVVVNPSFHPGNGNSSALSTIDGRRIARAISSSAATNCSPKLLV
jgi:hypothetical protein